MLMQIGISGERVSQRVDVVSLVEYGVAPASLVVVAAESIISLVAQWAL